MMVGIPEYILSVLLVVVPVASFLNWRQAWLRRRAGQPILPDEQRDPVPWGLADLALILILVVTIVGIGATVARQVFEIPPAAELAELTPDQQSIVFAAFSAASLLATSMSLAYLHMRWPGTLRRHGFSAARLGDDLVLGVRWFTMLAVPVLLTQLALTQWFPTKHPLIEMLRASGNTTLLPVAAFSAVIAAPLFEETLFRLIFQGWLEKLLVLLGQNFPDRTPRPAAVVGDSALMDASHRAGPSASLCADGNTASPALRQQLDVDLGESTGSPTAAGFARVSWIPILASAGFFSLAHVGHGPDWLPLFFLALGLGYLYQRTGRIQPCIVVHGLLNALGVVQLWAAVRQL